MCIRDSSKCVCVRQRSESSEPTMLFSHTTPDEHPPRPPPCRWPALTTLPTLAKFQLVWRRLCDLLFRSSCLFEHTLADICVLPEYESGLKYNIHSYILWISKYPLYFRPDFIFRLFHHCMSFCIVYNNKKCTAVIYPGISFVITELLCHPSRVNKP